MPSLRHSSSDFGPASASVIAPNDGAEGEPRPGKAWRGGRGKALACGAFFFTLLPWHAAHAESAAPPWADATASPDPVPTENLDPLEQAALVRCGPAERGLRETARTLVAIEERGLPLPSQGDISAIQLAAGEPHPWARAWAIRAPNLGASQLQSGLDAWLSAGPEPLRRCGAASGVLPDGARIVVVVSALALADIAPLTIRARVGQWLTVDGHLRVPAHGGRIVVLGPSGIPQSLLTSFDGSHLRARFAPDRAGEFAVQVVADIAAGPRPVLEARVFADVAPPQSLVSTPSAPGEDASQPAHDDADALALMVSRARESAGLAALYRDPQLDSLAQRHAARMAERKELAHDVGDGDPSERLHAAGLEPSAAGENVACAASVVLAHRAIWASPSHRAELLRPGPGKMGVGATRDTHGDAWVVELFTR